MDTRLSSHRSTGSVDAITGGSSHTLEGIKLKNRRICSKASCSELAALWIVPAASTATLAPPSSSLSITWPSERSTTGGPAAKTWLESRTITERGAEIARGLSHHREERVCHIWRWWHGVRRHCDSVVGRGEGGLALQRDRQWRLRR